MMILQPYEPRLFMPVPISQWREPSFAQTKDQFGHQNRTWFRVRAKLHDGFVVWQGWFDSRDDFDAFSWSLTRHLTLGEPMQRADWDLPSPSWMPSLGEQLSYDFATVTAYTSPTGSNQTWTRPTDWNNGVNKIETVGGGGSGARTNVVNSFPVGAHNSGGGGGAYSARVNYTASSTETYQIAASVAGTTGSGTTQAVGVLGGDTWFGATTLAASTCGAKGGLGGVQNTPAAGQNTTGSAGGASVSGFGSTKFSGGRAGSMTNTSAGSSGGSGGGGAAGPNGAGGNGGDDGTTNSHTAGGQGDNATGGGGGAGGNSAVAGNGSAGTEIVASSHGSGGGGGGATNATNSSGKNAGNGGNYGGGGGGACQTNVNSNSISSGSGAQGLIVITYTPLLSPIWTNAPLLGM